MPKSVLLLLAIWFVSSSATSYVWDNWNPSPPLGPKPSTNPHHATIVQLQQQVSALGQWCEGCILRCMLWRNIDMRGCSTQCGCNVPPARVKQAPFLPSSDTPEICPLGYAPTPVLSQASTHTGLRREKRNVDDLDELVTPYWLAMPFAKSLFQDRGVKFSNAFSSTSICCAARCQLLTGLYGHNAGVLTNEGMYGGHSAFVYPSNQNGTRLKDSNGKCINNEQRTLPLFLQQAGYKTGIWGKYINGIEDDNSSSLNSPVPPGWNQFSVAASRGFYTGYAYTLSNWQDTGKNTDIPYQYYGTQEQDYCTDVVSRNSIQWIQQMRNHHGNAPLFMYLASTAPHFPLPAAPRHMNSSDRWYAMYNSTIPNRPNWNADLTRKPFYLRDTIPIRSALVASPWFALDFVKRMGSLMAVDELIQSVYQKFEQLGELQRTVFILTSDNGYNNGAQRLAHKMSPYEESVRIPLYFSGAGIFQGKVIDEPAVLSDLAPTILDFANLQAPSYMDGKSWFSNLLVSLNGAEKRSEVYLQYRKYIAGAESDSAFAELPESMLVLAPDYLKMDVPPYRGLRTNETLFVEYTQVFDNGTTAVEYEAYNLEDDPYQLNNEGHDLDADTFDKLLGQLNQYAACSGRDCW